MSFPWKLAIGGASSCSAVSLCHPIDVMKIRMQLQGETGAIAAADKVNVFRMLFRVVRSEGVLTLTKGLSAAMSRQIVYSSIRYGSYPVFKNMLCKDGEFLPLWQKIAASMSSGAIGSFFGSPNDLMLVRMQSGNVRGYRNVFHGMYCTFRSDGLFGLWRGAFPTVIRGAFVTMGQIASYDQIKQLLIQKTDFFKDDLRTHFTASSLAGIIATVITNPIDLIKTRLMNMKPAGPNGGEFPYKGVFDCAVKVARGEGLTAFYKGFVPSATRLVPVTILTFLFYERFFAQYLRFKHPEVYRSLKEEKEVQ